MRIASLGFASFTMLTGLVVPVSAAPIAYESFNYTLAADGLPNATPTTATGFTGNWNVIYPGGVLVPNIVSGLTGTGLPTNNRAVQVDGIQPVRASEALSTPLTSGTIYVSALLRIVGDNGGNPSGILLSGSNQTLYAGAVAGFSGTQTRFGLGFAAATFATTTVGTITSSDSGAADFSPGTGASSAPLGTVSTSTPAANLLLMKIDFDASGANENISFYLNPSTASLPASPSQTLTGVDFGNFGRMGFVYSGGDKTPTYDEFRIGTTYADVIPEPTSLTLLGAAATGILGRRRRACFA